MSRWSPILAAGLLWGPATAGGAANTLCSQGEQVIFSCRIEASARLLSLCASHDLGENQGHLQYRYGRPGRIELQFPAQKQASQKAFTRSRYLRPMVIYEELGFVSGGFRYTVFDHYNAEGNGESADENAHYARGVAFVADGNATAAPTTRMCVEPVQGRLDALEGIVPQVDYSGAGD